MFGSLKNTIELINGTTIEDAKFGPMWTMEEIAEELGFEVEEGWKQLSEDSFLLTTIAKKANSTWIYLDIYSKEDYEYITAEEDEEDVIAEDDDVDYEIPEDGEEEE